MPTLAEMRAHTGPQPLPKKTVVVTLVEGQHLLAESEELAGELLSIVQATAGTVDQDGERTGPPRKQGQKIPARADEIRDRQAAIPDELAAFQGELGLTGLPGGEWQRFKDEHPPRENHRQDLQLTGGLCNSAELFAELGKFVTEWNGEVLAPDDWNGWLAERITYADRRDMVTEVVRMHEKGLSRSPKFVSSSGTTKGSATG